MEFANYLYEKLMMIILNVFSAIALSIYLTLLGNSISVILPILMVWCVILIAAWGSEYYRMIKKTGQISNCLEQLEQKYLIIEMLGKPQNYTENLYRHILRAACKSMLENVNSLKNSQHQYKEYIEEWIHEIKTPITAIDLICKNRPGSVSRRISNELSQIDYLVEQALYYARSENVEKDYFVKAFPLFDALGPALQQNRTLLLEEHIMVESEETSDIVYTDKKWLTYILNQILSNSIKYHRKENARIKFSAIHTDNSVSLVIEDNGQGIRPEDLPRIFEKGFTGNDRGKKEATGMGLYLSHKLCLKLGLHISAESVFKEGTKIIIDFPIGSYNHPERRK